MRKKVLLSLLILIIAASVLTACNKGKDKNPAVTYGDIYVQHGGIVRKTDYDHDRSFALPEGLMPYYEEKGTVNTYKEYVDAYDKENGVLKVRKDILGENGKVASSRYGFVSLKTKNLIGSGAVYSADFFVENGFIGAYNADTNKYELFRNDGTRLNVPVSADSKKTSEMFMTLSEDYYALSDGNNSWQIYAANNSASPVAGGKKFSTYYFDEQAQKAYDVSYIVADNYIIATRMIKATSVFSKDAVVDVVAYDLASGNEITSMFKGVGAYSSGAIRAAYYLGGDKFYCYEQTSSTKDDGYQYKVLTNPEEEEIDKRYTYYKISVWTYDMKTGAKTLIVPDRIFSTIVNKYYKKSVGRDLSEYINNGYSWVSVAITRDADRVATQDQQYVIDSNLNIYVSLSDKSGSATRYDEGSNDYRYVKLTFVDGYGFDEDSTSDLIIYDKQGNTVLRKEGTYSKVFYNNGIVTAVKEVADGSKYVVAYKLDGTVVFDETREYSDIVGSTYNNDRLAFVGKYAMVKKGTTYLLVDNTGRDVGNPSVSDMYTTKRGAFFFNGVYVTQDKKTLKFGLKNYDGDVIFENQFKEVIIDAKRFGDVAFYAKDENGVWNVYFV